MKKNQTKTLSFSGKHLNAKWIKNIEKISVEERTIVVNIGTQNARISVPFNDELMPRTSTILEDVSIECADSLLLVSIKDTADIGSIALEEGWNLTGDIMDEFPEDIPLWKSSQDSLDIIELDPYFVTGQSNNSQNQEKFLVKVNLWFAPENTNASIHNQHCFLEIHTQIYGTGRMQKFHQQDINTLYEDIIMSPGDTNFAFATVQEDGQLLYPWHQYRSDNDCIWMAIEFHPQDS